MLIDSLIVIPSGMNKEAIKQRLSAFRNAIDELERELDKPEEASSPAPRQRRNLKAVRMQNFSKLYNKTGSVTGDKRNFK